MSNAPSFSYKIKDEICSQPPKKQCCRRAFIYGVILGSRRESDGEIRINAGEAARSELLQKLVKERYGREAVIKGQGKKKGGLTLCFFAPDFSGVNFYHDDYYKSQVKCPECQQALFGGLFVSSGSVNRPDDEYYLQFNLPSEEGLEFVLELLSEAGVPLARSQRRGKHFIYTRSSSVIEDFLAMIHSPKAYFELINAKIIKDIRNDANRRANCDTGNITKSVGAAQKVLAAIRKLEAADRLTSLPAELEEAARLRAENPQASIERLGLLANPSVTKSGMNHRLNKIIKIADELK